MHSDSGNTLVILPGLQAVKTADGGVVITSKFLEGMRSYAARWNGPVRAILDTAEHSSNNLDNVTVYPDELPFYLDTVDYRNPRFYDMLTGSAVVLGGPHYKLPDLNWQLRQRGIVSVPCVEYSLRTRLDVARVDSPNVLRLARRAVWEVQEERRMLRDFQFASGIQCNGTPTYDAYTSVRNRLLYFDTRTSEVAHATPVDVLRRQARALSGAPLHLAFSGRLIAIKGVHHLTKIAHELRKLNVAFKMSICGGGDMAPKLEQDIRAHGLGAHVSMRGVLHFESQLLPFLREEVDLFVSPHLQGDPSCTYLETLACGVPIVGYANEAWQGLIDHSPVLIGWASEKGNPKKLALEIQRVDRKRELLVRGAQKSVEFAREHSFDKTFERRVAHLENLLT